MWIGKRNGSNRDRLKMSQAPKTISLVDGEMMVADTQAAFLGRLPRPSCYLAAPRPLHVFQGGLRIYCPPVAHGSCLDCLGPAQMASVCKVYGVFGVTQPPPIKHPLCTCVTRRICKKWDIWCRSYLPIWIKKIQIDSRLSSSTQLPLYKSRWTNVANWDCLLTKAFWTYATFHHQVPMADSWADTDQGYRIGALQVHTAEVFGPFVVLLFAPPTSEKPFPCKLCPIWFERTHLLCHSSTASMGH